MKKNYRILILIVIILAATAIFFLPLKVPYSIKSVAKILPARQWILSRGSDGQLLSNRMDYISGINKSFQLTSFERGESINLQLAPSLSAEKMILKGDTLGVIYATNQNEELIRLSGERKVLQAELTVKLSGEKQTEVHEARERLAMAESEFDKQNKIVIRLKEMLENDIIAHEKHQTAADELHILTKAVDVRQAELASCLSGVKKEEINKLYEQINAIENEITFLQQKINSQNFIIAPFNGRIERTGSTDTLLILSNYESGIAYIPVSLAQVAFIHEDSEILFESAFGLSPLSGNVKLKHPVMHLVDGKQCLLISATVHNTSNSFISGLIAQVKIACDPISLPTYLMRNFLN